MLQSWFTLKERFQFRGLTNCRSSWLVADRRIAGAYFGGQLRLVLYLLGQPTLLGDQVLP